MARLTDQQDDGDVNEASAREANSSAQSKNTVQPHHDIPKFDLAEQILAEQRKRSAVKRKGPGKRAVRSVPVRASYENALRRHYEPSLISSAQEQIIAEIVARDIERLIGENASSPQS